MAIRLFLRATEPHSLSLAAVLFPLIGGHLQRYEKGTLSIEADFGSVTDQQIQAAVDAAPTASAALDARFAADRLTLLERAAYLTLLDLINVERGRHGAGAVSAPQYVQAVKDKVESLGG
jgi:hypothetical protein